jgi:lipopolysaccharide heptosyltransferase II
LRRGSGAPIEYTKPKMFLDEDDIQQGAELLAGFDLSPEDNYAVVAFQAVAESRRWGVERYAELSRRLLERHGFKILLIGSAKDAKAGDEFLIRLGEPAQGQAVNLAGKTSLRELATVCSRAAVFVGNDSGPAHLAAAVGTPIVVISGPDDPRETSPISNKKRLLYLEDLECISCVKNRCPLKGDEHMQCMTGITVDMVEAQAESLLAHGY